MSTVRDPCVSMHHAGALHDGIHHTSMHQCSLSVCARRRPGRRAPGPTATATAPATQRPSPGAAHSGAAPRTADCVPSIRLPVLPRVKPCCVGPIGCCPAWFATRRTRGGRRRQQSWSPGCPSCEAGESRMRRRVAQWLQNARQPHACGLADCAGALRPDFCPCQHLGRVWLWLAWQSTAACITEAGLHACLCKMLVAASELSVDGCLVAAHQWQSLRLGRIGVPCPL